MGVAIARTCEKLVVEAKAQGSTWVDRTENIRADSSSMNLIAADTKSTRQVLILSSRRREDVISHDLCTSTDTRI